MNRLNRLFPAVPAALKKLHWFRAGGLGLLLLPGLCGVMQAATQPTNSVTDQIADVQMEMNHAIEQVQKIVNQPVTPYGHRPGLQYSVYHPGWFHEGANRPDFNNVDVRKSQEFPYASHEYVTSDLNPGVLFRGRDLEFNSNTKYFYTDRSVPKKKLTEPEMLEINRLYRIIGHCEHQLLVLQPPKFEPTTPDTAPEIIVDRFPILKSTTTHVTLGIVLLLAIVFLVRKRFA